MILFIVLLITTIFLRVHFGFVIESNPIFFVPLIFIFQFGIPVLIYSFLPGIRFTEEGVSLLCLFPLLFILGNAVILFNNIEISTLQIEAVKISPVKLERILLISITLSTLNIFLVLQETLKFASLDFSIETMLMSAGVNSAARYTSEEGRISQGFTFYLSAFHYLSAITSGVLSALYPNRIQSKFYLILSLLIGLVASAIEGSKFIFLVVMIFIICSKILYSNNRKTWFSMAIVIKISFLIIIVILLFFSLQALRYFSTNDSYEFDFIPIIESISISAVGHLSAFCEWVDKTDFKLTSTFGRYTFSGIVSIFGVERLPGLYGDENIYILNSYTNVYTAYRGILQDFTYLSFVIIFMIGIITQLSFLFFKKNKNASNFTILLSVYVFFMWGHIASIFNYNIILLVFFINWGLHNFYFNNKFILKI